LFHKALSKHAEGGGGSSEVSSNRCHPILSDPLDIIKRQDALELPTGLLKGHFHPDCGTRVRRRDNDRTDRFLHRQEVDYVAAASRIEDVAVSLAVRAEVVMQAYESSRCQVLAKPFDRIRRVIKETNLLAGASLEDPSHGLATARVIFEDDERSRHGANPADQISEGLLRTADHSSRYLART
jgi:hypothetical protein